MAYKRTSKGGGPAFHKDPVHCSCPFHRAQLRKAQAFALSAGVGGESNEAIVPEGEKVIEADLDPIFLRGRTPRERIVQLLAFRSVEPGITNAEVAKRLGITAGTLNTIIYKAGREGWLRYENPLDRIENEIIPKAIQNLSEFLDEKDKQATLETLKGTAFPVYRESKGAGEAQQTVLALKIETAEPVDVKVLSGQIVGTPRRLIDEAQS